MDLPADLQKFISTHIGWEYNQLRDEARRCNNITKSEYMGTYFPRSFVESYEIFELLTKNEFISEALSQKVEIHVLDIGSGTGGNFLGYLWFLQDKGYLQHRADLAIYLRSYDKDRESLEIQDKITRRFFNPFGLIPRSLLRNLFSC